MALLALTAATGPVTLREQGVLYTGGGVSGDGMSGQMHVFYRDPRPGTAAPLSHRLHPWQPPRRRGFPRHAGWPARLGDLVGRPGLAGLCRRSAGQGAFGLFPGAYGPQERDPSRAQIVERFTASETIRPAPWPTAHLHTQWPGTGLPGDPVFEQFFASEVANMPDVEMQYALTTRAVTALLLRIGPAIIVTHSQAGPLGWMIAQANPGRIRAIIAVEPTGNASRGGKGPATACGITIACLDFTPALPNAATLALARTPEKRARDVDCWLQPSAALSSALAGADARF